MKDLSVVRLKYKISHHLDITLSDIQNFLQEYKFSKNISYVILIGNLLEENYPQLDFSFNALSSYTDTIAQLYCICNDYNENLRQWIQFYFILGTLGYDEKYTNEIYQWYKSLPPINDFLKEEQIVIAQRMLPYYFDLHLDYSELLDIYGKE